MSVYSASLDHMRMNYIASEKRRNAFHGEGWFQTDEELGEEFDAGIADLLAQQHNQISNTEKATREEQK
jgi:hypothetical protein